jgi:hypothetical protein
MMVRLYFPAASFAEERWAMNTIRNEMRKVRTIFDLISPAPAKTNGIQITLRARFYRFSEL